MMPLMPSSVDLIILYELRENYWFVFYSERMDLIWIITSAEFIEEAVQNKTKKNAGKRSAWFNGKRTDKKTGIQSEYCKKQYIKYLATDFNRLIAPYPNQDEQGCPGNPTKPGA
jgi:hypothetical protein